MFAVVFLCVSGLCGSGAAHAVAVESGLIALDPAPFAAGSKHGLLVIEPGSSSGEVEPLAMVITCADDRILDLSEADCFHEIDEIVAVSFPLIDFRSGLDADLDPMLFPIPSSSDAPQLAAAERSFDNFRRSVSDALGSQTDEVVIPPDGDASSIITGDSRMEDAVPALAAAALLVAGLLLLWFLRRHRRAASVRRIKLNASRNRQTLRS